MQGLFSELATNSLGGRSYLDVPEFTRAVEGCVRAFDERAQPFVLTRHTATMLRWVRKMQRLLVTANWRPADRFVVPPANWPGNPMAPPPCRRFGREANAGMNPRGHPH